MFDAPQGNRLDLVELNLPLKDLLDLAFIRTLLHLLSTNQVQELGGQDEVTLHGLWNNRNNSDRKSHIKKSSVFLLNPFPSGCAQIEAVLQSQSAVVLW